MDINYITIINFEQFFYYKDHIIDDNKLVSYDKDCNPFDFNILENFINPTK